MKKLSIVLNVAEVVVDLLLVVLLVLYIKEYRENALAEIEY